MTGNFETGPMHIGEPEIRRFVWLAPADGAVGLFVGNGMSEVCIARINPDGSLRLMPHKYESLAGLGLHPIKQEKMKGAFAVDVDLDRSWIHAFDAIDYGSPSIHEILKTVPLNSETLGESHVVRMADYFPETSEGPEVAQ